MDIQIDCRFLPATCLVLNRIRRKDLGGHFLQGDTLFPEPFEEEVKGFLASGDGLVRISSFIPELFKKTVEFWLELGIAGRIRPLAQKTKPL